MHAQSDRVAFRRAAATDLEALVVLAVAFRDHLTQSAPDAAQFRAGFARLLGDGATAFFVAERAAGGVVGYVQSRYRWSAWSGGEDVELEDVYVDATARGHGVGRGLVEFALAQARARGCRVALLTTNERNGAAVSLYERLGFSAARARWQGGRQLWFERRLEPA